jgi:acyl carrier protein
LKYDYNFPSTLLFNYPTIIEISTYIYPIIFAAVDLHESEHAHSQMVADIQEMIVDIVGIDIPEANAQLMDIGIDSFAITDLVNKLSLKFDYNFSPTLLFNYPTINEVADHVLSVTKVTKNSTDLILSPTATQSGG